MKHEAHKRKRAREVLTRAGYKIGGHLKHSDKAQDEAMIAKGVHEHESHLHKGEKKTRLKLADGGVAEGSTPKRRGDKKKRGQVNVNVLVGGPHPPAQPAVRPVPVPVPPPGGAMAGPPGGPGMPPPQGLKRGGRARHAKGGHTTRERDHIKGMPHGHFKKGGRTKAYPLDAGAGGALGRLEKAESEAHREGGKR